MLDFGNSRKAGVTYRITQGNEDNMRLLALTFDAVGFIAVCTGIGAIVTEIIGFIGNVIFFVWFRRLGLKFSSNGGKSKVGTYALNAVIEIVPFLNGFYPGFSIQTKRLIDIMHKEDEAAFAKQQAEEQAQQMQYLQAMRALEIREQQLAIQEQMRQAV